MSLLDQIAARVGAALPNHRVFVSPPEPGYDGEVRVAPKKGSGTLPVRIQGTSQKVHLVYPGGGYGPDGRAGCCARSLVAKTRLSVDIMADGLIALVQSKTKVSRRLTMADTDERIVVAGAAYAR